MTGLLLADSSVWVSMFRRPHVQDTPLTRALADGRVLTTGPVVAELLQGLREPSRVELEKRMSSLPLVTLRRRDWLVAGHVAGELRGRGTPVSLADVEIATAARSVEVPVLTADRDFLKIAEVFGDLQVELVD